MGGAAEIGWTVKTAAALLEDFPDWFRSWYWPPDPYKDGREKELRDEANATPVFEETDFAFAAGIARGRLEHELAAVDRFDRRGFALLTVSLSMLTVIFAGIGSKSISAFAATPMILCVLNAIVESLVSLSTVTGSATSTISETLERAASKGSAQTDFIRNAHVVAETISIGVQWRSKHLRIVLRSLGLAAAASLIAIAFRPSA